MQLGKQCKPIGSIFLLLSRGVELFESESSTNNAEKEVKGPGFLVILFETLNLFIFKN